MSFYALYGTGYNQLARMATAATPEGADSLYPIANLYDGAPWKPFRFATAGGSGYIDFDLNQVVNGEFGTAFSGGLPGTGWGKTSGATLSLSAGEMVVQGTASDYGYYDLSVSPGEVLVFSVKATAAGGAGGSAGVQIINLSSGSYLDSNGSWGGLAQFMTLLLGASQTNTKTVTVESWSACGYTDRCTIRLIFLPGAGAGPTYPTYDNVLVYPRINFASIHGHNIQPNTAPIEIRSATSSPGTNVRATMTLAQPTMFSAFTNVDERYWRLYFTNDPLSDATWLGEVVLGQYQTLTRRQNFGQELTVTHAQDRDVSELGPLSAYVRQEAGRRRASISFRYNDDTDYDQAREIVERSKGGAHPLVLVLESGDETMAMLGRISPDWKHTRETNTMRDAGWEFEELPFPVVLP